MLAGLKIVEYASYIAAPGAGGMLADWGAEIIKIEPLNGDAIRGFFDSVGAQASGNPVFELDNRGKRSLALDTSRPEGLGVLRRLIAAADVFLTNVRPAALKRSGLDYQSLKGLNARLVYAIVTGYGLEGPMADKPGMDVAAFWSRAGVGRLTTPKHQEIFPCRTGMGDHMTGLAVAAGIMGALYARERTGKGRLVETSLLRTGIYAIGTDMAIQLRLGRIGSTKDRAQSPNPIGNFFEASCGNWICLLPRQGNADWPKMCAALGQPELANDPRFATPKVRRENRVALVAEFDRAFAEHPLVHWEGALDAHDIIWAPVQTPAQVAADPQAQAAGAFVDVPDGSGGSRPAPATPVAFPADELPPLRPSPAVGEHSREILAEAGYTEAEIDQLVAEGVVRSA
jgi:crotonobetainyl-CoA:carnitine CoA-transferase CaiB-like acyl-CoA transferase